MKKENVKTPIYQRIAADIASKIVEGHYNVGDKLYARSTLAVHYNVSSETARRAISLLVEMHVCESRPGSGVIIKSREKAIEFVKLFQDVKSAEQIKREVIESINRSMEEEKKLKKLIVDLMDKVNRFRSVNPFVPYEILITEESVKINKSLSEMKFWNNTYATIVGIRRNNSLLMSPGPKQVLKERDIVYFVGSEACQEAVKKFLYEG